MPDRFMSATIHVSHTTVVSPATAFSLTKFNCFEAHLPSKEQDLGCLQSVLEFISSSNAAFGDVQRTWAFAVLVFCGLVLSLAVER